MRVLQVLPSLNLASGGVVEGAIQQGLEIERRGHLVDTLTLDPPAAEIDLRLRPDSIHLLGPAAGNYGFSTRLDRWLREHRSTFDVVVVHGVWQYHSFCVRRVVPSLGKPYVVFTHGMLDPWFAQEYPLKHAKKWIYWWIAERMNLRKASRVLFTTEEEMLLARHSFSGYRVREKVVGFGIKRVGADLKNDTSIFINKYPALKDKTIVLFLSRLHPKKGCDLLIRGFAKIFKGSPSHHLVFAGPCTEAYLRSLELECERLGIESLVTFTGMLEGPMKWGAYQAADVFVLPSHQENFGVVIAESLSVGTPVLTTRKVNTWREIVDEEAGIVSADTQDGIDQSLRQWVALSPSERAHMRARARACFESKFSIDRSVSCLLDTLSQVVEENRAAAS